MVAGAPGCGAGLKPLLYLSPDGLMEALGFSQVVRIIEALSTRGWAYDVISLEKPQDLAREDRFRQVRLRLARAGINWKALPWVVGGTPTAAFENESALLNAAFARARTGGIAGIHARAYHAAFAALACRIAWGTPYLFDTRSYWFDERLEEGRWFTSPLRLAVARGVEHQLFAKASAVVTLTELQAADVTAGSFGENGLRPVQCITTCADFDEFTRRRPEECSRVPLALREQLAGRTVLGIVGSLNRSYLVDETLRLASLTLQKSPSAHLLVLTAQQEEYAARLRATGIAPGRFSIAKAEHDAMSEWLSLIDWGLLLLQPASRAKRASMPTKLAEFFACGVRPVQFGCSSEVSDWVRTAGSGFVLPDVTPQSLEAAAERIIASSPDAWLVASARAVAAPHFSLEAGIKKYESVLVATFGDLRGR